MDAIICPKIGKIAPTESENNLFIVVLAFVFALLLLFVGYVPVKGSSMLPTIRESGDNVIIVKHLITPDYGDIVIVNNSAHTLDGSGHELLIKRVVAKAGDRVSLERLDVLGRENEIVLKVNGEIVDEPYIDKMIFGKVNKLQEEIVVPENSVYVLGDNRKVSLDSRSFGPVSLDMIDGVAVLAFGSGGFRLY